jgi:D-glycero-D-manno-heptose 1,7-bisphosphate phosphatase
MSQLIILDRDGVINADSDAYIKSPDEFILLPNTIEAIVRLKRAGWTVAVATNQSGLARGLYDRATLHLMHEKFQRALRDAGCSGVDWISFSPYAHVTPCRKPNTGLYQSIAWRFGLNSLAGVPVVGDSWRDLDAAMRVNARPIQVKTGKGARTIEKHQQDIEAHAIPVVDDVLGAVLWLEAQS